MKIAFITTRTDKASFKFRISQYLPHLEEAGIYYKTEVLPKGFFRRRKLFKRLSFYDLVFLQKRLLGFIDLLELKRNSQKLIYDFDDSIMYNHRNGKTWQSHRIVYRFKNMMNVADHVIAGNNFLANHAKKYTHSKKVTTIPSVVDTSIWDLKIKKNKNTDQTIIGWVGSQSTLPYWFEKIEVWKKICQNYPQVKFRVICDRSKNIFSENEYKEHRFEAVEWDEINQVVNCSDFDIGIMPLPDNQWSRGKCGFKLIQYLSLGIPAIASPVGVNSEIVLHENTGLIAKTNNDWESCLKILIEDPEKRYSYGRNGYLHVRSNYALDIWLDRFLCLLLRTSNLR